jgi:hypothetical protein
MKKTITYRALLLRVNRHLESEGSQLKRCRESASDFAELGPYFLVRNGQITDRKLNLEDFARKLSVLNQFEKLESEEK